MAELKHLYTAWDVDRHIVLDSADKLVLIRFSSYENPPDEALNASMAVLSSRIKGEKTDRKDADDQFKRQKHRIDGSGDNTQGMAGLENTMIKTPQASSGVAGMEHYLFTHQIDALLVEISPKVRKYCTIYAVDTNQVPEFNQMYELGHDRDPFAVMFFFRNTHIRVDVGTGNHNKINFFAFEDADEFISIIDAAYRAGKLGKNMTSSDKKYSTVSLRH
ncbi:unnamed protein product [Phytomonas sp. EM1]|nr:unnamed protein product [Phytomonas sp. EM1]|eukprot:CCW63764.1 unnamed protein product [Phytomonas sp. isolate EM1]